MKVRTLGGKSSFYRPINIKKPERSEVFLSKAPLWGKQSFQINF